MIDFKILCDTKTIVLMYACYANRTNRSSTPYYNFMFGVLLFYFYFIFIFEFTCSIVDFKILCDTKTIVLMYACYADRTNRSSTSSYNLMFTVLLFFIFIFEFT